MFYTSHTVTMSSHIHIGDEKEISNLASEWAVTIRSSIKLC